MFEMYPNVDDTENRCTGENNRILTSGKHDTNR
jgi:hypothetical protein